MVEPTDLHDKHLRGRKQQTGGGGGLTQQKMVVAQHAELYTTQSFIPKHRRL
jgi:hypothetical protein